MMAEDADVIFAPAGYTGVGAVLTATQSGVWGIGVDTDYYETAFDGGAITGSERLLSSAMKRIDNAVFNTIGDVVSDTFTSGTQLCDLEADGVGLAPFHEAAPSVSQDVRDRLEDVRQGIINGAIDVADPCRSYVYLPLAVRNYPRVMPPRSVVSAAFVYIGPPGQLGWTYEHDRGRQMLEAELGDKVETTWIEDVPEGPDAAPVFRQYAQEGWDVIFATSFGYMEPTYEVAAEFPDVIFEHCSGSTTRPNMATYYGRMYQARYLSGIVAGEMTDSDIIGYVAPFPFPETIRGIDAFTLGARWVNADAEVRVAWTYTWYDPVKEREAAEGLLDEGADVIAQHQDTTEPQKAAAERDALSIGYGSDMRPFVGDTVLTSAQWNWGAYYVDTVEDIIGGRWQTHAFWGGLKTDVVELAEMSPLVPDDVRQEVEAQTERITGTNWDVFCGPIRDQDGIQRVPDGQCMSDQEMLALDWFVQGVVGVIP
jgi:basic membrane protein A